MLYPVIRCEILVAPQLILKKVTFEFSISTILSSNVEVHVSISVIVTYGMMNRKHVIFGCFLERTEPKPRARSYFSESNGLQNLTCHISRHGCCLAIVNQGNSQR